MRLCVDLTRPHADFTLLRVHLMRCRARLEMLLEALLPTFFRLVLYYSRCSINFFTALFYFPCIVNCLYFCTFNFILLFVLLFVGFYLFTMMWFDLEEEIDVGGRPSAPLWFFVVPTL
jgi:hypothetical protein